MKGDILILFRIWFSGLVISLYITMNVSAQEVNTTEVCTHSKIKTVLFHRTGWDMSMPVYYLKENESLEFSFDYLDKAEVGFAYKIINCSYDWKLNDIPEHYFLKGFNDITIQDYQPSRNTTQFFTHYSAIIPNEELKILSSGNYLLQVYDRDNPSVILVTRRFCVAEENALIEGIVKTTSESNQEINLKIDIAQLNSRNPLAEVKIVIIKNYDWNNTLTINSPALLQNNILRLDMPFQLVSPGGNEFRYFDTKSTKTESEKVSKIEYCPPLFCFSLKSDEFREFSPYFTSTDINGRFYVDAIDSDDRHLDADYVEVFFSVDATQVLLSNLYLYGALTGWKTDSSSLMKYNENNLRYEKRLLLKQGYYNYAYVTDDKKLNLEFTEGNHAETENEYLVFVYFSNGNDDIDRLVGFSTIKSR